MASIEELIVRITADNSDLKTKMNESSGALDKFGGMAAKLGPMIAGAFSVTAVVAFGKASYDAFESQEKANKRLLFALKGNQEAFKLLTSQAAKFQSETGVDEEQIMQIQMLGAAAGMSAKRITEIVEASINLAAATGGDLQGSYMTLIKSLSGVGRGLKVLGADFADLTEVQLRGGTAIDLLNEKYKDLAKTSATSTAKASAAWGEFQESFGSVIAPGINANLDAITKKLNLMLHPDLTFWQKLAGILTPTYGDIITAVTEAKKAQDEFKESITNTFPEVEVFATKLEKLPSAFENLNTSISDTEENIKSVLATGGVVTPDMVSKLQAYKLQLELVNAQMERLLNPKTDPIGGMSSFVNPMVEGKKDPVNELRKQQTDSLNATNSFNLARYTNNTEWIDKELSAFEYANMAKVNALVQTMGILSGVSAQLFGEQTAAYKVTANAQAIMSTYQAANIALASAPPPFNFILMGATIAAGLANVAQINGVGMETGGIVPSGYPNDTYPAMLTSGETVVPPGKLPEMNGAVEIFGKLRAGDIYLSNKRGAYIMNRRG